MSASKKHFTRFVLILLTIVAVSINAKAQTDKIEGLWYNDVKTAKIQITKENNGKFYGKVVWLKEPLKDGKPKVDEMNSDEKLRSRPRLGLPVLADFVKDGDNKYSGGTIYDPNNGKTYSCKMTYKGKTLDIRGYIGISLFGRTTTWSRAE
ncbi:DUF2147 domain-containing protein [Mucilaginibacter rubeus]|uniref:DUF2147 domain-containing protein n=1 Tax=Mucilaginibacter rubeus TaxID=2027860 RepID=A0AAE6JG54_9SPHI|nr:MULTISPECIES: DUF2147 domain-containing protein [Mucilaginibacter]QEM04801.1 DUF2147 domain-containing protein [Mucilaginibacter rubeus]QEM17395.1 DUF2147 domain-containing protein [Mucilaginibacter gossypii]QTE46088.1 DUF2147 domain-containing protein [Mucilaginibacter rubeus]QTE52686.1 DUF2147 domain-containing protein [Mucilaginibacter rubeus]QTE57773.1 DUF2147 domain-containing protein [Mucilaginibacter rubeus]